MLLKLTDLSFEKDVLQSELPVCIAFYATWWKNYKNQLSMITNIIDDYKDKMHFALVDVDMPISSSHAIIDICKVRSIPTFQFYKNGKMVYEHVGLWTEESLKLICDSMNLLSFL